MTDMPEQIWVGCYYKVDPKTGGFSVGYSCGLWRDHATDMQTVEYTRTDLVPTWQPIETAPKETEILTFWPGNAKQNPFIIIYKIRRNSLVKRDGFWGSKPDQSPTHWMPLPQEPSEAI